MQAVQKAPGRPFLALVFVSPAEPRLRAGWRLVLQILLQIILTLAAGILASSLFPGLASSTSELGGLRGLWIVELLQVVCTTISVFAARRLLDHRSISSLGLQVDRRAVLELAVGIAFAAMMMGLIFFGEESLGWLRVVGFAASSEALPPILGETLLLLGLFAVVAWNEELMSRGYHLQALGSGLGLVWGLVLSSAIFGALHLGNPNATWISAAGIFLAGIMLGYAYVRTRRLWLSIGLHLGWNFFEGVVFGFPVSGLTTYHLTRIDVTGPSLWTGGAFGPEAGMIVVPAIALGLVLIHLYSGTSRNVAAAD